MLLILPLLISAQFRLFEAAPYANCIQNIINTAIAHWSPRDSSACFVSRRTAADAHYYEGESQTPDKLAKKFPFHRGEQIQFRYELTELIFENSKSAVFKAFDHKTKRPVAIKAITNGDPRIVEEAQHEESFLKRFTPVSGTLALLDSFTFDGYKFFTFEMLGTSVAHLLLALANEKPKRRLSHSFVIDIARQILEMLKLFHEQGVVHADLKPQNVLFNNNDAKTLEPNGPNPVTIIDYGSMTSVGPLTRTLSFTLPYRAPEALTEKTITTAFDMWSFGCFLFEMVETGRQLFQRAPIHSHDKFKELTPSKKEESLDLGAVALYYELLGTPPRHLMARKNWNMFFNEKGVPNHMPEISHGITLAQLNANFPPRFLPLLLACIKWDPADRITAADALELDLFH